MTRKRAAQYTAPALEKGLDILEYLADQAVARSQTEIASALKRSQGEIYRMLACLQERGYVVKLPSGTYRLSLRLFELAHRQSGTVRLLQAALPPMETFCGQTGQSVHLSVQHGSMLMVLVERMPPRRICLAVGEGTTLPLSQAASGKVLLSRMPRAHALQVLDGDTSWSAASAKSRNAVMKAITQAQADGCLVTRSELTPGAVDIAIPVGVAGTDTSAVVAVPFVSPKRGASKATSDYLKALGDCARAINTNLGVSV
jgi:DNA-binding IclR family transcriptional regulator